MIRYSLLLKGHVQGVGCRFFINSTAITFDLTGWVKNLDNGTVQVEVQGPASRVDPFIETIHEGNRFVHVSSIERTAIPVVDKETTFRIHY